MTMFIRIYYGLIKFMAYNIARRQMQDGITLSESETLPLLPNGWDKRGLLGVGSIAVTILPSCHCMHNNIL